MAWADTLQDASYRGVALHIVSVEDATERAAVIHEYPYRNGAEVEDLGRKARVISIQAIFWGEDYEEELGELLDALDEPGSAELIHPVFGSVTVTPRSHRVHHDEENPDYAQVSLEFVEAIPDQPFFGERSAAGEVQAEHSALENALESVDDATRQAVAEWGETLLSAVSQAASDDALSAARTVFLQAADYAGVDVPPLPDVSSLVRGDGLLTAATGLADAVLAAAGIDLSIAQPVAAILAAVSRSPRRELSGTAAAPYDVSPQAYAGTLARGPWSAAPAPHPVVIVPPTEPAPPAFERPDISTVARQATAMAAVAVNLAAATATARRTAAVLAQEPARPTLTPTQVENLVGVARQRVQDSICDVRAVFPAHRAYPLAEGLRTAALSVQKIGARVIRLRPPLTVHTAPSQCNLHLLAHWLYGDYTRATELARLNPGVRNPNFIGHGQDVYGYAR